MILLLRMVCLYIICARSTKEIFLHDIILKQFLAITFSGPGRGGGEYLWCIIWNMVVSPLLSGVGGICRYNHSCKYSSALALCVRELICKHQCTQKSLKPGSLYISAWTNGFVMPKHKLPNEVLYQDKEQTNGRWLFIMKLAREGLVLNFNGDLCKWLYRKAIKPLMVRLVRWLR